MANARSWLVWTACATFLVVAGNRARRASDAPEDPRVRGAAPRAEVRARIATIPSPVAASTPATRSETPAEPTEPAMTEIRLAQDLWGEDVELLETREHLDADRKPQYVVFLFRVPRIGDASDDQGRRTVEAAWEDGALRVRSVSDDAPFEDSILDLARSAVHERFGTGNLRVARRYLEPDCPVLELTDEVRTWFFDSATGEASEGPGARLAFAPHRWIDRPSSGPAPVPHTDCCR